MEINSESQSPAHRARYKAQLIEDILREEDLYKILGAPRDSTPAELRRAYLDRSKICHPDRLPYHESSTAAFQRLAFAFEILKSPSSRRTYDRASRGSSARRASASAQSLNGDQTFRGAVEAMLHEFMTGDFALVKSLIQGLNRQYPNLVSEDAIDGIERSWFRVRDLILSTRSYALLVSIELGRINRVQKNLRSLGYFDVFGRMRMTAQLVKVTLAVPMRVDRALRLREERERRATEAGWNAAEAQGETIKRRGGILNDRVFKVLEFIVGESAVDPEADAAWIASTSRAA
ncbi:hypothetical protein BDZ91DRAFT_796377 [Kalaharituber pfeilii]|nr:hypothetical protein BDZ91DRAFT_796377 [Kalaharituber pfeilii]